MAHKPHKSTEVPELSEEKGRGEIDEKTTKAKIETNADF